MSASDEWRRSLLLWLSWQEDPAPLDEAHAAATALAGVEIGYRTQRQVKRELVRDGLVTQRKRGKHFVLSATAAGLDRAEEEPSPSASPPEPLEAPELPYRVGAEHLLPRDLFGALLASVRAGEVDLLVIPSSTRTKIGYWNA